MGTTTAREIPQAFGLRNDQPGKLILSARELTDRILELNRSGDSWDFHGAGGGGE
jgi:hypothetical protein